MEFVHPQMLECLICRLTYQLHKPYNVCRGIRHLKSRHPEIMPEFNGEPLRRYRKTGTALRLDDDPNIPRRRRDTQLHVNDDSDLLARMKAQYPGSFDKVQTIYGAAGEPMYVLMSKSDETEEVIKENMKLISNASAPQHGKNKQRAENNGEHLALDEVKPRQEVVFELSYDYDNLDAHGKPRKHLVRVTPGVQNKLSLNSDSRPRYLVRNEGHSNTAAEVEQSEPNEVYFGDAEHGDENSTEESAVIFGDVLFIDADGNEIIQRTTALPDGTIQQQYLGQAEDGSLYVLSDIVSTGLHPYADSVEEVFEEMISDDVPQQELILDDYESHLNNIPSHRHQVNNHSGQSVETEVQQKDFDSKSSSLVAHTYNGGETIVVEEYCDEEDRLRQKYGREIVISGDARYDEDETVLNEEVFRSGSVVKQEELVYDADENTTKQQFDRNVSDGEQLSIVTPSTNVLPPSTTDINNRS
ncbi:hypothetical protein DICVIV_04830 [Dictyocaulus viviparus]|uniref:Uncharacterized protein n=1 Tax=Dictyocaulus viviparus TaxID=29172 RepID=A0A0D8Y396_DICVI|nr:hypothetical protein DICVIV_04830 [Dictyocaulus viviparus]